MSTITGALRHVFPRTADDSEFQILGLDTTQVGTTTGDSQSDRTITGNEWIDLGNIHVTNNASGLIARNAFIRITGIVFGGDTYDPDAVYLDFEDCIIEIYGDNNTTTNASLQGGMRFNNCTFIKAEGADRDILGNFADGTRENNNLQMTNCRMVGSSSEGPFHLLTQNLSPVSNLTGTAFVGNAQPEMPAGFGLGGVTVSNIGSTFELPTGDAGIRWGIRHTQHLTNGVGIFNPSNAQSTNVSSAGETAGTSAVSTRGNFPSESYTPMSNIDFSAGIPGIQVNRNVSAWYINHIPRYVGNTPQNISVTYHDVNGPWDDPGDGGSITPTNSPAEIRTFTGWRPVAREGNNLVGDYLVFFPNEQIITRPQANYDPFTIPVINTGTGISYFVDDTDTGFWIQDRRYYLTIPLDRTSFENLENSMQAGGLPALQPLSAVPFRQYSFTHNTQTIHTDIPTRSVVISQGITVDVRGSQQNGNAGLMEQTVQMVTDPLVGSLTAATAPAASAELTTLDEAYAALKRVWYQDRDNENWSIAGDADNRTITIARQLNIRTGGDTINLVTGAYRVRSNGLSAGTLINRVNTGGNTIDFGGTDLFANTTISGGTLNTFTPTVANNVTFDGTPTLTFAGGTHNLTGWDARGRFTPAGTGVTLTVTSAQALEFFGDAAATTAGTATIDVVGDPIFLTAEVNTGSFIYRVGTGAVVGPFDIGGLLASSANANVRTQANLIPGVTNRDADTITIWYLPESTVNGVGGETQTTIYDFNRVNWVPTTGNLRLTPFQPDASLLLFGAVNAAGYTATAVTDPSGLDAGIVEFTISDGDQTGIVHNAAQTQGIAVKILQSDFYLEAVATADLENNQRVISPAANNGIALNTAMQLIRLNSATQRQISNTSGILATQLSGGVPSVVSLTITLAAATVAQIRDNTISEQQVADLINQQSRALQGATVPGKGILNTPNDVTP